MRPAGTLLALALCVAAPALSAADSPFTYWIATLSWSPEYCRSNLTSKEPQCQQENEWVIADLRPHVSGPEWECDTDESVPKDLIDRMVLSMKNVATIKRVWRKSGACSKMPMKDYFLQLERAGRKINVPSEYRDVAEDLKTTPDAIREAFVKVNDGLTPGAMVMDCKSKYVQTVGFCLDGQFNFRECGIDLSEDCRSEVRLRRVNSRFR
jgi:ribonuclease T2